MSPRSSSNTTASGAEMLGNCSILDADGGISFIWGPVGHVGNNTVGYRVILSTKTRGR